MYMNPENKLFNINTKVFIDMANVNDSLKVKKQISKDMWFFSIRAQLFNKNICNEAQQHYINVQF